MDLMVAISRSPLTPPVSGVVDPPASTCLFSWDLTASISSCVVGGPLRRGFTELKKELIMFAISERVDEVAGALEPYTPGGDGPVLLPTVPGELDVTGGFRELRKEPVSIANGEGVEEVAGALEPYSTVTTLKGVDDVLEPPGGDPMSEPIALTAFLMLLPIDPLGFRAEVMAFPMLLPTVPGEVPGASLGGHNPGGHIPGGHIPAG